MRFREWLSLIEGGDTSSSSITPPTKAVMPARPVSIEGPLGVINNHNPIKPAKLRRSGIVGGKLMSKR